MIRRDFFRLGLAGAGVAALAPYSWALEYYPLPSDKKWAVVFGTWCGSSRDAAVWISEGMGGIANVFDARERPDLKKYDHVIIGGSIRANAMPQELVDVITEQQSVVRDRVRGYFAVCGNMRRPVGPDQTKQFIDDYLAVVCGAADLPSTVFLGRITKSLMDPETATRMEGFEDYDNLKRSECMAFGDRVLASIRD